MHLMHHNLLQHGWITYEQIGITLCNSLVEQVVNNVVCLSCCNKFFEKLVHDGQHNELVHASLAELVHTLF